MKEKVIQVNFINNLISYGWTINNKIKTIKNIKERFLKIVKLRNQKVFDQSNITNLSHEESERLFSNLLRGNNPSQYRDILLDEALSLKLDNGKSIYIDIFNPKNYEANIFEIAQEVKLEIDDKRMDVLLLINGIPLTNIELKAEHVTYKDAIRQLKEYSKRYTSMFNFVQLLVASNNRETVYFANNQNINNEYIFNYSNNRNENIHELSTFTREFFQPYKYHRYISNFLINKRDDSTLLAIRGYQLHGIEAILKRLKEEGKSKNGYLWHATGSGKTVTSFLSSQMIKKEFPKYEKVIFLVDRTELDDQTYREYNSFLPEYEKVSRIKTTFDLFEILTQSDKKLIITTIHKMNDLISKKNEKYDELVSILKNKDIVFIFDEGHRSQAGDMHQRIKETFLRSRLIGFTGTPIFDAEVSEIDNLKRTTNEIFDKNLHAYLLKNAINDRNVLPFTMSYFENDVQVDNIFKYLQSSSYVTNVTKNIIENFENRSFNRNYSSMLVAANIKSALKFYKEFKLQQKIKLEVDPQYKKINVAITYSMQDNYYENTIERIKAFKEAIEDFNFMTNSNESASNSVSRKQYQNRLQSILKNEVNAPKVNLTIVVDRLLTGFDAKRMNTLYVAKELKLHALIQAFSRTNRVFDRDKSSGNVISYVPGLEKNVKQAIAIYSNQENADGIFTRKIEEYILQLENLYHDISAIDYEKVLANPLKLSQDGKDYINKSNNILDIYRIVKTMDGFYDSHISKEINDNYIDVISTRSKNLKSTSQLMAKKERIEFNPYDKLDLPIKLVKMYAIDGEYISNVLNSIYLESKNGNNQESLNVISDFIEQYQNQNKTMNAFLEKIRSKIESNTDFEIKQILIKEINYINSELKRLYSLTSEDIERQLKEYKFYGNLENMKKIEEKLRDFYKNIKDYSKKIEKSKIALNDIKDKIRFRILSNEILEENN